MQHLKENLRFIKCVKSNTHTVIFILFYFFLTIFLNNIYTKLAKILKCRNLQFCFLYKNNVWNIYSGYTSE